MSAAAGAEGAEATALAALDDEALRDDVRTAIQIPSLVGSERAVLTWLADRAAGLGLRADLHEHDLAALRVHPDQPGEEVERTELVGLAATLPGARPGLPRLALCGHVDVVDYGTVPWEHGSPTSGHIDEAGYAYGRGSADMKGAVVAMLHALSAVREGLGAPPACEATLLAVGAEEDGGMGAFAALERDAAWDACVIGEPTGWDVVPTQAGALTFAGVVRGRSAHAARRLDGVSAIDRYLPLHAALQAYEDEVNADVADELMGRLELPYPVLVGRVAAGTWSSQVPDRLAFEGRVPVRVGERPTEVRAAIEARLQAALPPDAPPVELAWTGGQFASARTDPAHPFVRLVGRALQDERARPSRVRGVPWGADLRLFAARGIPTTMLGTPGMERAHGVDERVALDDVRTLARTLVRVLCRFGT